MNKKNSLECRWPDWQQELLLRASLLEGQEALDAWQKWKSRIDIDQLDLGSRQLLPLLYKNLSSHGVEDPMMNTLKGAYRATWCKNQLLFRHMANLLHAFQEAGVQTMLLKGTAMILLYYRDYGLRPMIDFDVLVPTAQAPIAIHAAKRLGWRRPESRPFDVLAKEYFSLMHAAQLKDEDGRLLDLHWHLLNECCEENADDDFWAGAVRVEINDVSTLSLNPADQLFHTCIHGISWQRPVFLRMIADAMVIIKGKQAEIDWDRLLAQAIKRHLILRLRTSLSYLHKLVNALVPPPILKSLQNMPVSKIEYQEYTVKTKPPGIMRALPLNLVRYRRYKQSFQNSHGQAKAMTFPIFFLKIWEMNHLWQIAWDVFLKGIRRIYKFLASRRR